MLKSLGVAFEAKVVSAHRTPDLLFDYAASAGRAACAPLSPAPAARLPAAKTIWPVLGVPVPSRYLEGMDSLLHRTDAQGYSPLAKRERPTPRCSLLRCRKHSAPTSLQPCST